MTQPALTIGVLGTGDVGRTLATALRAAGHDVALGSRTGDNPVAAEWAGANGGRHGTYAAAAEGASVLFNATRGNASVEALASAGDLTGTVIVDVANKLPPVSTPDGPSLAEEIQQAFPGAKVVKTLHTMNCGVMVDPSLVPGPHNVFLSGDDAGAKAVTRRLLEEFGWPGDWILDLGDLSTARGTEAIMPLWLTLWRTVGTLRFNLSVHVSSASPNN
jgi:8-hydroxy-5-deazaflavin:NADPH oxidoreductase